MEAPGSKELDQGFVIARGVWYLLGSSPSGEKVPEGLRTSIYPVNNAGLLKINIDPRKEGARAISGLQMVFKLRESGVFEIYHLGSNGTLVFVLTAGGVETMRVLGKSDKGDGKLFSGDEVEGMRIVVPLVTNETALEMKLQRKTMRDAEVGKETDYFLLTRQVVPFSVYSEAVNRQASILKTQTMPAVTVRRK